MVDMSPERGHGKTVMVKQDAKGDKGKYSLVELQRKFSVRFFKRRRCVLTPDPENGRPGLVDCRCNARKAAGRSANAVENSPTVVTRKCKHVSNEVLLRSCLQF